MRLDRSATGFLLALVVLLGLSAAASAVTPVTRYAAPGGGATAATCTSPTGPFCTIDEAASGTGVVNADEVVITPGNYSDNAGDLGADHNVNPIAGNVHGQVGQPRPVITLENPDLDFGAFFIGTNATVSDVEIVSSQNGANLTVAGGTAERIVSRSDKAGSLAVPVFSCAHLSGTIRNSACLSTGAGGIAIGQASLSGGTVNLTLRGVTAVSTGANSFGLSYSAFGGTYTANVDVRNTIARGTTTDVRAAGVSQLPHTAGTGGHVAITLDYSNYATEAEVTDAAGGTASVTNPGTANNETAAPALAADGYHQLPSSTATINQGNLDGLSGPLDIDRQQRQIGLQPTDIGADELPVSSNTTLSCTTPVLIGGSSTCTATVSAAAEAVTGNVSFSSDNAGDTFAPTTCTLSGALMSKTCQVTFTPSTVGTRQITASYAGDSSHGGSAGSSSVAVQAIQTQPGTCTSSSPCITGQRAAAIKKGKKKFRKATQKRKKCIKKAKLLPV